MENQAKRPKSWFLVFGFFFLVPVLEFLESLGTKWDMKDPSAIEQLSVSLRKHLGRKTSGSSTSGICRYVPLEVSHTVLMSDVVFLQS